MYTYVHVSVSRFMNDIVEHQRSFMLLHHQRRKIMKRVMRELRSTVEVHTYLHIHNHTYIFTHTHNYLSMLRLQNG